jgi:hypothetical protein
VSADRRRWALRAILLLPTYWLLRDTVRLHVSDYVSLVVIPWAVLVLASWLLARRAFDPGEARLRLVLAVVAAVCAWGVLQVGRMATRVVLVPALLAAAACVAPPLGPAAAALGVLLAVLELALRLAPALLPVDARLALAPTSAAGSGASSTPRSRSRSAEASRPCGSATWRRSPRSPSGRSTSTSTARRTSSSSR